MAMVTRITALLAALWLLAMPSLTLAQSRVVIVQGADAQSLDPAFRADAVSGSLQRHVFDTVLFRNADMGIGPGLATAVERVGPTRWRIRLRPGVSFTNGEPMNAAAVKFSIERINDPALRATARPFFANLTAVDVVDDTTLEVTTQGPDPLFPARMTLLGVVPPRYVQEAGASSFGQRPVGTGPYTAAEWRKDDHLTLAANPAYWGGAPHIQQVVFRVVPEELARVAALRTGEAQLAVGLSPSQAESLRRTPGIRVEQAASTRVMVLAFNAATPPGDQLRFRQAVGAAVNREEIIRGLLRGFGAPVTSIFGPGIADVPEGQDTAFAYEPERARRLVAELNLGNTEIELRTPTARYPFDRETALAVAQQLRRIGLNVRVRADEWGVFFNDLRARHMSAVYVMGHGNVWMDPLPQLDAFVQSRGFLSTWSDTGIDAALARSNELEPAARRQLFGEVLQKLHDDAVVVPLFSLVYLYGVAEQLRWHGRADDILLATEMELQAAR
jgi:peptide/nickel transport system substrate-binding protein